MKKTYIIPQVLIVRTAQHLPICGSLTPDQAIFFESDATTDAMTKGNRYNVWDEDWSAE